jgi:3-oxoacyl-[acyl-carrier-protein] synthase II
MTTTVPVSQEIPGDPSTPVITSAGMVTALGGTTQETWEALLVGRCIADHTRVDLHVPDKEARVLALARQAIRQASSPGKSDNGFNPERTALVVATSKGPVENWLLPPIHMSETPYVAGGVHLTGLGEIAERLGAETNCRGPRLTISAACASGVVALIRAAMLIGDRQADRVLVVAAEASVHPLFIGSFRRLGVLPKPGEVCRPFDRHRSGFLMSEAAAAVWIERAGDVVSPPHGAANCPPKLLIDRFALGGDAVHLAGMDPTGRVLRQVITRAIGNQPVDLVHAHGTGTILNDAVELSAIQSAVATRPGDPFIYSHKGALGHSLGASGLLAVVLNYLIHSHGIIPPNARTTTPIPAGRLRIERESVARPVKRSLAISAGFGGAIAAMAFRTL